MKVLITDKINEIDLFGSFGIGFFSSSKNGFNAFFILLLFMYIIMNRIIKLIPKVMAV